MLAVAERLARHDRWPTWPSSGRLRVGTEYPELTRRALRRARGATPRSRLSYGATEAKVPEIADCVVEITETGRALRAAGLRIVETLLVSHTELIANPAAAADPDKRHAMEQILTLLQGTLEAREKVLVKLNVPADQLDAVIERPAVAAGPDRLGAVGRRRLRGRDGGAQGGDQHPHPGAEGPGGHRHPRAGPVQDRALMDAAAAPVRPGPAPPGDPTAAWWRPSTPTGGSARWSTTDDGSGDGSSVAFHCTAIADGTRRIAVGTPVMFVVVPGTLGQLEARESSPRPTPAGRLTRRVWRLSRGYRCRSLPVRRSTPDAAFAAASIWT